MGYVFVCISYVTVGAMGYIGFMSVFFKGYFIHAKEDMIAQNCLNMFDYLDVPAFVLRTAIFFENFTTYPLLSLFVNDMIQKAFWRGE